ASEDGFDARSARFTGGTAGSPRAIPLPRHVLTAGARLPRPPCRSRRRKAETVKGLVCAGGEATRLGELTRVANKHLLPVGRWPMIYYPLKLLERAGIREVLVVTGKGHAGQMIDLLGNGRLCERGSDEVLFDLD